MADPKLIPGKFVWFELLCNDPKTAQNFYAEVLGWKTVAFPMGSATYEMIYAGDTMIGGYQAAPSTSQPAHFRSYVSVDDVDASVQAALAHGGKLCEGPIDTPGVGRRARIVDPQGAELSLIKRTADDPVDTRVAGHGRWVWNELHTTDPAQALLFYAAVVGFSHTSLDMGPGGTYHVLSKSGQGRGGVSGHLPCNTKPHWLPYVAVDDVDAAVARARTLGATIQMNPQDIPGVGRISVLLDPTGAALAVMKPNPGENHPQ